MKFSDENLRQSFTDDLQTFLNGIGIVYKCITNLDEKRVKLHTQTLADRKAKLEDFMRYVMFAVSRS